MIIQSRCRWHEGTWHVKWECSCQLRMTLPRVKMRTLVPVALLTQTPTHSSTHPALPLGPHRRYLALPPAELGDAPPRGITLLAADATLLPPTEPPAEVALRGVPPQPPLPSRLGVAGGGWLEIQVSSSSDLSGSDSPPLLPAAAAAMAPAPARCRRISSSSSTWCPLPPSACGPRWPWGEPPFNPLRACSASRGCVALRRRRMWSSSAPAPASSTATGEQGKRGGGATVRRSGAASLLWRGGRCFAGVTRHAALPCCHAWHAIAFPWACIVRQACYANTPATPPTTPPTIAPTGTPLPLV